MALFIAYNHAWSATTDVSAGTSYVSGTARCAIQLKVGTNTRIRIVEYGVSFDGNAAATPSLVELAQASAASTVTTALSNSSTAMAIGEDGAATSRLTYSTTTDSGYGNGAITSNTTQLVFDKQYVAPTNQYVKLWPLGREPLCDPGTYVQLRLKTSVTVNAIGYIVWEELQA